MIFEYLPVDPAAYRPAIGLIGCGWVSGAHLTAYRRAGYNVVALCDAVVERAEARRDEYFPDAAVYSTYADLLERSDIEVVDIATHVPDRPPVVEDALRAGKHVLSQKPFVADLDVGDRLCDLADECSRLLAVNQNGRWAPHFSYLLGARKAGLLGRVTAADFQVYWPHDSIVRDMPAFATMPDLILYDFGTHWFDVIATLMADEGPPMRLFASVGRQPEQLIPVPTQAQVLIDYDSAQVSLTYRGSSPFAELGRYRVQGTSGVLQHAGQSLGGPEITIDSIDGTRGVKVEGDWWGNGMHGTMAELLCAIEEGRQPSNRARASMPGLALCFAAIESSRTGRPVDPATVRRRPTG